MNVATKADVENHFNTHGTGEITEIKLMNGFGFIEYKDAMDARDVVPGAYFPSPLIFAAQMFYDARSANSACSIPYVIPPHPICCLDAWLPLRQADLHLSSLTSFSPP